MMVTKSAISKILVVITIIYVSISINQIQVFASTPWFDSKPHTIDDFQRTSSRVSMISVQDEREDWIAFLGMDGNIDIIHSNGSDQIQLTTDAGGFIFYTNPIWSPGGDKLSALRFDSTNPDIPETSLIVWDITTLQFDIYEGELIESYDWMPDSNSLVFSTPQIGGLFFEPSDQPAISPYNEGLKILDLESNTSREFIRSNEEYPIIGRMIDISPDGKYVSFSNPCDFDHPSCVFLGIINLDSQEIHKVNEYVSLCDWKEDSSGLRCAGGNTPFRIYDVSPSAETSEVTLLGSDTVEGFPIKWSPDRNQLSLAKYSGLMFAFGPREYRIYNIINGEYTEYSPNSIIEWSPNGDYLIELTEQEELYRVDVSTGERFLLTTGRSASWQPFNQTRSPEGIADLTVSIGREPGSVKLTWTPPSDAGLSGRLTDYDVRYSNAPIDDTTWDNAIRLAEQPPPTVYEWRTASDQFSLKERWYFAIKYRLDDDPWSRISNSPSIIDTGFRPWVDGYSFRNGPYPVPDTTGWEFFPFPPSHGDFTPEDIIRMFGRNQVCLIDVDIPCNFKPGVLEWYYLVNIGTHNGHCLGMATTSLLLYEGYAHPDTFQQGTGTVFERFEISNIELRRSITYYHAMQLANPLLEYILHQRESSHLTTIIDQLMNGIVNNEPAILGITIDSNGGMHSITPISLSEKPNGIWEIFIYDTNDEKGQVWHILIDTLTNNWGYEMDNLIYDESSFPIFIIPISLFFEQPELPTIHELLAAGNGRNIINILDQFGNQIQYIEDSYLNNIPGASIYTMMGDTSSDDVYFFLPKGGDYQFTLRGQENDKNTVVDFTIIGEDYSITLDNPNLTPSSTASLEIRADGKFLSYRSDEDHQINFSFEYMLGEENLRFDLQGIEIGTSDSLEIQNDFAQDNLILRALGSQSGNYDLVITRPSLIEEQLFESREITIEGGQVQALNFSRWKDDHKISQLVDGNNDGEFEKNNNLTNDISPSLPGLSDTSRSKMIPVLIALSVTCILVFAIGSVIIYRFRKNQRN